MSNNITYLLGAGASANCLPVIDEFPERLQKLHDFIDAKIKSQNQSLASEPIAIYFDDGEETTLAKTLTEDIRWVLDEIKAHNTIDTLAKKFYLLSEYHPSLLRLKKVLSTYFFYEENVDNSIYIRENEKKQKPDKRYDSLIATIVTQEIDNIQLPSNFNIITWNYDTQFEHSFANYSPIKGIHSIQNELQIYPTKLGLDKIKNYDSNKFCLVRLNGVVDLSNVSMSIPVTKTSDRVDELFLHSWVCRFHFNLDESNLSVFTYAWEDTEKYGGLYKEKPDVFKIASEIMRKTDILVVIGYSFPIFNRKIDKGLINALPQQLKAVYIQDKRSSDVKNLLMDSFEIFISDSGWSQRFIKPVNYTNQFFIPPEADI